MDTLGDQNGWLGTNWGPLGDQYGSIWVVKMEPLGDQNGCLDTNWSPLGDHNGSIWVSKMEPLGVQTETRWITMTDAHA